MLELMVVSLSIANDSLSAYEQVPLKDGQSLSHG